jgi:3-oxoacyl-[acyl-carrier protein] reductase
VTGASKGIGAAIAKALAANGVKVLCFARGREALKAVVDEINDAGGVAIGHVGDTMLYADVAAASTKLEEAFGALDIAFLNAGGNAYPGSILNSDIDKWNTAIELNLNSVYYGIRAFAPLMQRSGGGRIILTGSAMAHLPQAGHSSYCVSKAGARVVARTAALELAEFNISVNELIPGPTVTEQARRAIAEGEASPFSNPAEWAKEPEDVVPLALMVAAYPGKGPTGQIFSLARR